MSATNIDDQIYPIIMGFRPMIAAYIRSDDAAVDDILSAAIERAWVGRKTFRGDNIVAWLSTITRRCAHDYYRRTHRAEVCSYDNRAEACGYSQWSAFSDDPSPEEVLSLRDEQAKVRQAVEKIHPRYKEMVESFYWKDMSYREICAVLGIPTGTLMSSLYRARGQVAAALDSKQIELF